MQGKLAAYFAGLPRNSGRISLFPVPLPPSFLLASRSFISLWETNCYKLLCLLSDNNRKWFPVKKLDKARSQLYRSQILQENMRWKALAEIYTMHSFTPFWNPLHGSLSSKFCLKIAENIAKCLPIFRKRSIFVEVIRVLLVVLRRGFTGHSFCFRRTGIATGSSVLIWNKLRVCC